MTLILFAYMCSIACTVQHASADDVKYAVDSAIA